MGAEARNPKLCEACSAIFSGEAAGSGGEDDGVDVDFDHHETLASFREAVAQKCPICRRLFEMLSKEIGGDYDKIEKHIDPSEYATTITLSPYSRSLSIQVDLNLLRSPRRFVGAMMHFYPWEGERSLPSGRVLLFR